MEAKSFSIYRSISLKLRSTFREKRRKEAGVQDSNISDQIRADDTAQEEEAIEARTHELDTIHELATPAEQNADSGPLHTVHSTSELIAAEYAAFRSPRSPVPSTSSVRSSPRRLDGSPANATLRRSFQDTSPGIYAQSISAENIETILDEQPAFSPLSAGCLENQVAAEERARIAEEQLAHIQTCYADLQIRLAEEQAASVAREQILARQHQAELELLNRMLVEERAQLAVAQKELYDMKSLLLWGETDSDPPTFVKYSDYLALQQRTGSQAGVAATAQQQSTRADAEQRMKMYRLQQVLDILLLVQQRVDLRNSDNHMAIAATTAAGDVLAATTSASTGLVHTWRGNSDALSLASDPLPSSEAFHSNPAPHTVHCQAARVAPSATSLATVTATHRVQHRVTAAAASPSAVSGMLATTEPSDDELATPRLRPSTQHLLQQTSTPASPRLAESAFRQHWQLPEEQGQTHNEVLAGSAGHGRAGTTLPASLVPAGSLVHGEWLTTVAATTSAVEPVAGNGSRRGLSAQDVLANSSLESKGSNSEDLGNTAGDADVKALVFTVGSPAARRSTSTSARPSAPHTWRQRRETSTAAVCAGGTAAAATSAGLLAAANAGAPASLANAAQPVTPSSTTLPARVGCKRGKTVSSGDGEQWTSSTLTQPFGEQIPDQPVLWTPSMPALPFMMHQGRFMSPIEPPMPKRRSNTGDEPAAGAAAQHDAPCIAVADPIGPQQCTSPADSNGTNAKDDQESQHGSPAAHQPTSPQGFRGSSGQAGSPACLQQTGSLSGTSANMSAEHSMASTAQRYSNTADSSDSSPVGPDDDVQRSSSPVSDGDASGAPLPANTHNLWTGQEVQHSGSTAPEQDLCSSGSGPPALLQAGRAVDISMDSSGSVCMEDSPSSQIADGLQAMFRQDPATLPAAWQAQAPQQAQAPATQHENCSRQQDTTARIHSGAMQQQASGSTAIQADPTSTHDNAGLRCVAGNGQTSSGNTTESLSDADMHRLAAFAFAATAHDALRSPGRSDDEASSGAASQSTVDDACSGKSAAGDSLQQHAQSQHPNNVITEQSSLYEAMQQSVLGRLPSMPAVIDSDESASDVEASDSRGHGDGSDTDDEQSYQGHGASSRAQKMQAPASLGITAAMTSYALQRGAPGSATSDSADHDSRMAAGECKIRKAAAIVTTSHAAGDTENDVNKIGRVGLGKASRSNGYHMNMHTVGGADSGSAGSAGSEQWEDAASAVPTLRSSLGSMTSLVSLRSGPETAGTRLTDMSE